jgi:hypothetical protein
LQRRCWWSLLLLIRKPVDTTEMYFLIKIS